MESGLSSIDWELVISTGIVFSMLALTHALLNYKALSIPLELVGYNRIALWLCTLLVLPGAILHASRFTLAREPDQHDDYHHPNAYQRH